MAALALKIQDGINHMFDHAWPGDLTILGHMPHKDHGTAAPFGKCRQFQRRGAHLADRPRRAVHAVGPHGLNGIDNDKIGAFRIQRRQNVAQNRFSGQFHRCL